MRDGNGGKGVLKAIRNRIIPGVVLVLAVIIYFLVVAPGSASPSPYYVSKDGRVAAYLAGPKGEDTALVLEVVDEKGDPVNFTAFLSGPTVDKFEDVAVVRGMGKGRAAIGRYVAEAARLAKKLGYKPEEVRFGLVAFVTAVERSGNETYLLTDIVSIPIGPGEAAGREVVAKIKFKPKFKTRLNATAPTNGTAASATHPPVGVEATAQNVGAQSGPPDIIDMGCTAPIGYVTCYRYRAAESYSTTEGAPLLITYIDNTGSYIDIVNHQHNIYLSTQTTTSLSFEMSFAVFKSGVNSGDYSIEVIGPGHEIVLGQNTQKTLLYLSCAFRPNYPASCTAGSPYYTPVSPGTFSGDALLATGFVGDVRTVRYVLEQRWCIIYPSGAVFCGTWQPTSVEAWGVWLAGLWGGDAFIPYAEIDDNPNDGQGKLEKIYSTTLNLFAQGRADRVVLPSKTDWRYVIIWNNMVETSQSSTYFAVSIPVGVIAKYRFGVNVPGIERLSVGVSVTTSTMDMYYYFASVDLNAKYSVPWAPYYFALKNYYIKAAGKYYDVPVPIVVAYIPPRS